MGGGTDGNDDIEMGRQNMWTRSEGRQGSSGSDKDPNTKNATEMPDTETDYQAINWKKVFLTPKYIPLWIVGIVIGILTAVISLKHDQVVAALRPFAEKVRDIPAGWLIFIAILFVISFPPLFGHELVALLAGVVYGLWMGFGVVAAGTFIGEIGTWFAFKKFLRKKAEKMERTNLTYGSMARLCRDGGFWMVLVIRLSIIPSHMSTAVFSTCDVKFWYFAVSTFLTLPKQLILVYLGVLLVQAQDDSTVKDALFGLAGLVTIAAGVWIWFKMKKYKATLLQEQEERKQRKERMGLNGSDDGYGTGNPNVSEYSLAMQQGGVGIATTTYGRGAWQQGSGLDGPIAPVPAPPPQQHSDQQFEPYKPQYQAHGAAPSQAQPYGHYEQDQYYHGKRDDGDVGTAFAQAAAYGPQPGYQDPAYAIRKVDSAEDGRLAQAPHNFV